MSKKRTRIRIKQEYHLTGLTALRAMPPFEPEPETEPVLMRYVSSEAGWEAIEIGVLEKAAATPRNFAAFAKSLDQYWKTGGRVNGGNLRAAVHTAAYRLKAHHEETIALLEADMQAEVVKLKGELFRNTQDYYSALAEVWRRKKSKLDASAAEQKLNRVKAAEQILVTQFLKRNPSIVHEVPDTVKALVRVELVIQNMGFAGPPKRMLPQNPAELTGVEKPSSAEEPKPGQIPVETPGEAEPSGPPVSSNGNHPDAEGGKPASKAKKKSSPKLEPPSSAPDTLDAASLIAAGKIAQHDEEGEPGYVVTSKAPRELDLKLTDLGLRLVSYMVGEEVRQRYWGTDLVVVAKGAALVKDCGTKSAKDGSAAI